MIGKLALGNVRRSLRDYAIYFVTIALGVAVFYAFNTIDQQSQFLSESTSDTLQLVSTIMTALTYMLAVVLGFLMVYANNFLIRRRREEFGLYQALGMERRQVSAIMLVETLVASLGAFAVGIALGLLLSQFLVFVSAALFNDTVKQFKFIFSPEALFTVTVCFAITFLVMLLFNLRTVRSVRLVELMSSGRENESQRLRPLPLCIVLLAVSVGLIVWAYVRLTHDGLPVMLDSDSEMTRFWITTAIVTVGTFGLFWSLPTVLIAVQRHIPALYLRGLHMFTDRQIASRVNSASVTMAVTAMVLFLAMTSVSAGMSISSGINAGLENSAPFDTSASFYYYDAPVSADVSEQNWAQGWTAAGQDPEDGLSNATSDTEARIARATEPVDLKALLASQGVDWDALASGVAQANVYSQVGGSTAQYGATAPASSEPLSVARFVPYAKDAATAAVLGSTADENYLPVVPLSSYNALRELLGMEPMTLAGDEYLLTSNVGDKVTKDLYDPALADGLAFQLNGVALRPAQSTCVTDKSAAFFNSPTGWNGGSVVVPDELVRGLPLANSYLAAMAKPGQEQALEDAVSHAWPDDDTRAGYENGYLVGFVSQIVGHKDAVAGSFTMTGLVGYMAVYIGFVLVVSCASILAIQQLSGVVDSRHRYKLLSDIGAPSRLIGRSILAQVLFYFCAPLVVALCHSAVALKQVIDVVAVLTAVDILGTVWLAFAIFGVVYGGYLLVCYGLSWSTIARDIRLARR